MSHSVIMANTVSAHRATVARVTASVEIDGETIREEVTTEALRHPEDKSNPEIGEMLALGRALSSLGRRLERRAQGLTKHADDIKKMKETQ